MDPASFYSWKNPPPERMTKTGNAHNSGNQAWEVCICQRCFAFSASKQHIILDVRERLGYAAKKQPLPIIRMNWWVR